MRSGPRFLVSALVCAIALLAAGAEGQVRRDATRLTLPPDLAAPNLPSPEALARMPIDPEVRELGLALGSDSYREREAATEALKGGVFDHQQLYALIYQERLDQEQRHRLLEIVRYKLVVAPRGAVGISMLARQVGGRIEIEVRELIRGLPAERVLEIEDRIVEVDGRPVTSDDDLVQAIQTRRPGDSLGLTVRRKERDDEGRLVRDEDGNPIFRLLHVELELGSTDKLFRDPRRNVKRSEFVVRREHEARDAQRLYGPQPLPLEIRSGISGSFLPGDARQGVLADVDRHPAIVGVLQQRRFLEAAGGAVSPEVRREWDRTLKLLYEQIDDSTLMDADRVYLRRVIDRFRKIVEEG